MFIFIPFFEIQRRGCMDTFGLFSSTIRLVAFLFGLMVTVPVTCWHVNKLWVKPKRGGQSFTEYNILWCMRPTPYRGIARRDPIFVLRLRCIQSWAADSECTQCTIYYEQRQNSKDGKTAQRGTVDMPNFVQAGSCLGNLGVREAGGRWYPRGWLWCWWPYYGGGLPLVLMGDQNIERGIHTQLNRPSMAWLKDVRRVGRHPGNLRLKTQSLDKS